MKKITTLLALLIFGLVQAQENTENEKRRANELGFEFIGLVDGQIMFSYERTFGKHWSALVGAGPKADDGLVSLSGIEGPTISTGDLTYSGYKVLLEGRYYINEFNKGRATGFYVGAYIKYSDFNSDLTGIYTNSEGEDFNFLFDAGIAVRSLGFMVGYKLPLSKRFALDFLIAGPGTGNYKFDIQNKSDDLPEEFFDDLNEALENVGLLDIIDADFEFNRNKRTSIFNTVSFRYAISLKYSF